MEESKFDLEFAALMAEIDEEVGIRSISTKGWFEKHFDKLQTLIDRYKHNPALAKKRGDNAVTQIRRLAALDGIYMQNGEPLSSGYITQTMSEVRKKREKAVATPLPTDPHARARYQLTGERGAAKKVKSAPEVVVAPPAVAVRPEAIKENVQDTLTRLEKEKFGAVRSGWTGQDEFFLMEVLYVQYLEKKDNFLNAKFWKTVEALDFQFSSTRYRDLLPVLKQKLVNSKLWDQYKDLS
ncbi:hypothetical protein [Burkholderia contaminans]|uniref:hypothetical protein n=1 Tax=Burkholderia contaminans TaxID=488447 RepID=UPI00158A851B|nr:hypothetical protein [Burkholderia contaminans]